MSGHFPCFDPEDGRFDEDLPPPSLCRPACFPAFPPAFLVAGSLVAGFLVTAFTVAAFLPEAFLPEAFFVAALFAGLSTADFLTAGFAVPDGVIVVGAGVVSLLGAVDATDFRAPVVARGLRAAGLAGPALVPFAFFPAPAFDGARRVRDVTRPTTTSDPVDAVIVDCSPPDHSTRRSPPLTPTTTPSRGAWPTRVEGT